MRYDETLAARLRKVHHIEILSRLQAEMASRDIDGLVIFRNDYFNWLNTHRSLMLDANLQGMAMIAVPQTGNPVGICSDHEYQCQRRTKGAALAGVIMHHCGGAKSVQLG